MRGARQHRARCAGGENDRGGAQEDRRNTAGLELAELRLRRDSRPNPRLCALVR